MFDLLILGGIGYIAYKITSKKTKDKIKETASSTWEDIKKSLQQADKDTIKD